MSCYLTCAGPGVFGHPSQIFSMSEKNALTQASEVLHLISCHLSTVTGAFHKFAESSGHFMSGHQLTLSDLTPEKSCKCCRCYSIGEISLKLKIYDKNVKIYMYVYLELVYL